MPVPKERDLKNVARGEEGFKLMCIEHSVLNAKLKQMEKDKSAITAKIKEQIEKYGTEDADGNIVWTQKQGNKTVSAINGLRVSVSLAPEAAERLKANNLKKYVKKETIEYIDEAALKEDIESKKIPAKIAVKLYSSNESYALTVTVK